MNHLAKKSLQRRNVFGYKSRTKRTAARSEGVGVTYSIPVAAPNGEGAIVHKTFTITKPYLVWRRLMQNPPRDLNLKDPYNIALLAAIALFGVEYLDDVIKYGR
jgi:hypothetical protein